jgi:hypothetical protein
MTREEALNIIKTKDYSEIDRNFMYVFKEVGHVN